MKSASTVIWLIIDAVIAGLEPDRRQNGCIAGLILLEVMMAYSSVHFPYRVH